MDFKPMLAAPVVVMLVLASAAVVGQLSDADAAPVASAQEDSAALDAVAVEATPEPAPEAAAPAPQPAEPAPVEPVAQEPVKLLEDVVIRDVGQVEMTTHKTWTWNVESTEFRGFDVYLLLQTAEETVDWVAYCVESIIFDGAGMEVGRATGGFIGDKVVIEWNYGDAPELTTWLGEWRLELHVQGAALTDYDANVGVHY